jgi:hypothetical protein
MPEKSSSDFCCCDGCEQRPEIWDRGLVTPYLTSLDRASWKKYCCSCIPEFAHVYIIDSDGLQGGAIYKLWCNINSDLQLDQPLYTKLADGGILVGSIVIDITFHIKIRDGQCLLYIVSNALDADENTYGASKVIDAEARANPNNFCSTLSVDNSSVVGGTPYTEFYVNGYKIRISKADHIPIRGRDHCKTVDGVTIFDSDPIRDLCCNCNCICRCMCLSVSGPGIIISTEDQRPGYNSASIACLYQNNYVFENGVTVRIGPPDGISNDDIISCWNLDEVTGARLDSFDADNHLTESTPIGSDTGKILGAAEFLGDGVLFRENSYTLRFSSMSGTICLWAKPTNLSSNMSIIAKTAGNVIDGFGWKIWYNSTLSRFVFSISNGSSIFSVISPVYIVSGGWYFIAAKIDNDSKTISIQVNNGVIEEDVFTGDIPATTSTFTLGGQNSIDSPEYFTGLIDQVSLWKDAATISTDALYNRGFGLACERDDRCYLIVTSMGSLPAPIPPAVLLDKITNPCPRPVARWDMWMPPTEEISYERPLFMTLRCASEERCTVDISSCCPSGRTNFPSTLTADIQTGCYSCPTTSVTLVWDYSINEWRGSADMCGHLVTLSTGCGFNSIGFSSPPCIIVPPNLEIPRVGYSSCDPILAVFSGDLSGIGCCPGALIGINTITITIYE